MPRIILPSMLALACLTTPATTRAASVWIGDFETGDLGQWEGTLNAQIGGVDYITIVSDVVAQGRYAARIELHDDAVWSNGLKRVELNHSPPPERTAEGATTCFAWSFYLPETLSADPAQGTGYWESDQSYQSLMVWEIAGEDLTFTTRRPEYMLQWQGTGAATPGTWHRIAECVLWSQDPGTGRVDMWFDGEQVVTGAVAATLADANPAFTQIGLIRGAIDFDDVPVIYIDDAVEGDTIDDVHPQLDPGGGESGSSSGGDEPTSTGDTGAGSATTAGSASGDDGSSGASDSAADTGTTTTPGGTGGGDSTGEGAPGDGESGCGCRGVDPDGRTLGVALLVAVARRRRR